MSVFRDVSIPVGGVDYTVTPSNKLLRKIEGKGRREDPDFNLVGVVMRVSTGAGSVNDAAFVIAELINGCGGMVSDDQVLAHMVSMDDPKEYRAFLDLFVSCIMPDTSGKKPDAPAEKA